MSGKVSYEEFYISAIRQLRDLQYSPGINVVKSGFNEHLRNYYGKDINPTQITDQLVAEGKIEKKPITGSVMIYIPGERNTKSKPFTPPGGNPSNIQPPAIQNVPPNYDAEVARYLMALKNQKFEPAQTNDRPPEPSKYPEPPKKNGPLGDAYYYSEISHGKPKHKKIKSRKPVKKMIKRNCSCKKR
jgi:hypothetical protein